MATDPTSSSPSDNPSPETKTKSVKNYAITPRVLLEIVHGDIEARDLFLHGDDLGLHFYAPESVAEGLKNYLNGLITDRKASFFYARHLYRILVEHAIPVAGKKPRVDHPLELVNKATYEKFIEDTKKMMPEDKKYDPDPVAVALSKEVGLWIGEGTVNPLLASASVPAVTTDALFKVLKKEKKQLSQRAKESQNAARLRIIQRLLVAPVKVIPKSGQVPTTAAAITTFDQDTTANLPNILELPTFEPDSVTWALKYMGFFTGEDFMTPIFLEDLPKAETVENVSYFTFFYKPEKKESSAKVEIVSLLGQLARYEDLFIEPTKDPKVGEYYYPAFIWNTSEKEKRIEGQNKTVPGRREHHIYWEDSAKHYGNFPPKQEANEPPFERDFDTTFKATTPPAVPFNDPTREVFITGDIIDDALAARDKAVDAYYTQYWILLKDFVDKYHLPITIKHLSSSILWLKVEYHNRAGAPTGETKALLVESYYRIAELETYMRQIDRTYPFRFKMKALELDDTTSAQAKQEQMKWLDEDIAEENKKGSNYEGKI